ncbi:MAG: hypothetical protein ACC656_11395 [Candidatus Heimdallarchaeota archaeon]
MEKDKFLEFFDNKSKLCPYEALELQNILRKLNVDEEAFIRNLENGELIVHEIS